MIRRLICWRKGHRYKPLGDPRLKVSASILGPYRCERCGDFLPSFSLKPH